MFELRRIIEQLIDDICYPWEYTNVDPSSKVVKSGVMLGVVWYSRHSVGGSFESSFTYSIKSETILILNECNRWVNGEWVGDRSFIIDLAQPDSFQLASKWIRTIWNDRQPGRLPIDKPERN